MAIAGIACFLLDCRSDRLRPREAVAVETWAGELIDPVLRQTLPHYSTSRYTFKLYSDTTYELLTEAGTWFYVVERGMWHAHNDTIRFQPIDNRILDTDREKITVAEVARPVFRAPIIDDTLLVITPFVNPGDFRSLAPLRLHRLE